MCGDGGDDDLCILCNPVPPLPGKDVEEKLLASSDFPPISPSDDGGVPPGPDPEGFPLPE